MWQQLDANKWEWTGDAEDHYLLRHENTLVEYHDGWVHVYKTGDITGDNPMENAKWKKSECRDELRNAPEDLLWPSLLSPVYVR